MTDSLVILNGLNKFMPFIVFTGMLIFDDSEEVSNTKEMIHRFLEGLIIYIILLVLFKLVLSLIIQVI